MTTSSNVQGIGLRRSTAAAIAAVAFGLALLGTSPVALGIAGASGSVSVAMPGGGCGGGGC